jgi:acetyl esterase/lipase
LDAPGIELTKAEDFDPELLILFDAYVHGALDRRGFIERASKFAVGGVTGAMLLDALNPRFAEAQQVPKDDARLSRRRGQGAGSVPEARPGQDATEDVSNIKCPLLLHYAETDERVNAGRPAYEAALKANKIAYEAYIYPGTQHGFNNDTTPRYNKDAATVAWQRTIDFFKKNLKS